MNDRRTVPGLRRAACVAIAAALLALGTSACSDDSDKDEKSTSPTTEAGSDRGEPSQPEKQTLAVSSPDDAGKGAGGTSDDNIIGGQPIDIAELPWTVALVPAGTDDPSGEQLCGGVLIDPQFVMTAAHCVTEVTDDGELVYLGPELTEVVLGRSQLNESGGEVLGLKGVAVSTLYDPDTAAYDFAVLELEEPSKQVPIALPISTDASLWATGEPLLAAGWGCQRSNAVDAQPCEVAGGSPLEGAVLTVLPPETCASVFDDFDPVASLCTGDPQQTSATCNGDSGGPLAALGPDDRWYLTSLVSYGVLNGCPPGTPEAEAFVPAVLDPTEAGLDPNTEWWVCTEKLCTLPAE